MNQARLDVAAGETVCFDPNATTTVTLTGNVVVRGTLRMRPASATIVHTIRFTNIDESRFVGGHTETTQDTDVGLWVIENGILDAEGISKTAWLRAAGGLTSGSRTIQLESTPTGWRAGDELVITPTLPPTAANHFDAYDYPTIASISGATVTLDRALTFDHPSVSVSGSQTMTAEVLNMTRNVRIEGTPTGRAHITFNMARRPQTIRYVAVRYMGPQRAPDAQGNVDGVRGRYGMHFHRMQDSSRGSLVEGVSLRDIGNHGFVPHGSHGITARNVIVHNAYNNGFWWDEVAINTRDRDYSNSSHDNIWERSVSSRITTIPAFRGFRISAFALNGGVGNRLIDSVAVGVQGNVDASGLHWPEGESAEPGVRGNPFGVPSGVWDVRRTVSHNNKVDGWFGWQNTSNVHTIGFGSVNYYNGGFGIDHGAYRNSYQYQDMTLYGNRAGGIKLEAVSGSSRLSFRRILIDQAGMSDYAIVTGRHSLGTTTSTLMEDVTMRGYNRAGIHVAQDNSGTDGEGDPLADFVEFVRPIFSGNQAWLASNIHPASIIRIPVGGVLLELRRRDQPGDYIEALWNASVNRP